MMPLKHVVVSGCISLLVWYHFKSLGCAAVSFATGVLIDVDHVFDYYVNHGPTLKLKKIYMALLKMDIKRFYIPLHSYELVALLWLVICIFSLSNLWKAAAIGFTQHLIFDQLINSINPFSYFFVYRAMKGFKKELLIDHKRGRAIWRP